MALRFARGRGVSVPVELRRGSGSRSRWPASGAGVLPDAAGGTAEAGGSPGTRGGTPAGGSTGSRGSSD
ncbi:MAG TPA: hypothetical protein VF517_06595 [Thermoleophilaceae bacterium]